MAVNWLKLLALTGYFFLYGLSLIIYFQMSDIRIASLNVNGARDRIKRTVIYETMKHKQIDIFLLQETHSDITNAFEWEKEFKGLPFLSHKSSLSGGVAILFANSFTPCSIETEEGCER